MSNEFVLDKKIGHYKIIKKLGQGGMGQVYKVHDLKLDRPVALKLILGKKVSDKAVKRFSIEARATAKLNHPYIVTVYDQNEYQGSPYFTMELVEGATLGGFSKKNKLSIEKAIELMIKIGEAVHYAHTKGIVHRDLKPANIMMDGYNPKIMDFGLAKLLDNDEGVSKTGQIMGTLQYMAPEQAEANKNIDARADVYALGAILYELLTFHPIFEGGTPLIMLNNILNKQPIPPSEKNKLVPKDLEKICLKAIHKKREQRYQSAKEFIDALSLFATTKGPIGEDTKIQSQNKVKVPISETPLVSQSSKNLLTPQKETQNTKRNLIIVSGIILLIAFFLFSKNNKESLYTQQKLLANKEMKQKNFEAAFNIYELLLKTNPQQKDLFAHLGSV